MGNVTSIIVAFISGCLVILGSILTLRITNRDRITHAYNELAGTIEMLQNQINLQGEKINDLQKSLEESQKKVQKYEERDDEKTAYIRQLGHWFEKTCAVLDPDWIKQNPKPKLPDSLRGTIGKDALK